MLQKPHQHRDDDAQFKIQTIAQNNPLSGIFLMSHIRCGGLTESEKQDKFDLAYHFFLQGITGKVNPIPFDVGLAQSVISDAFVYAARLHPSQCQQVAAKRISWFPFQKTLVSCVTNEFTVGQDETGKPNLWIPNPKDAKTPFRLLRNTVH